MTYSHWRGFISYLNPLKMRQQLFYYYCQAVLTQSALLLLQPHFRLLPCYHHPCCCQILAYVIKIDQITALLFEALSRLLDDPPRPVSLTMNLCLYPGSGPLHTIQPYCPACSASSIVAASTQSRWL